MKLSGVLDGVIMESISKDGKLVFAKIFVLIGIFVSIVGAWTAQSWITSLIFVIIAAVFGGVYYNVESVRDWMQQGREQ